MKVAINGFGRIGRIVFKLCLEAGINVVAINDLTSTDVLAYLLKYDSVYGRYDKKVEAGNGFISVGGKKYSVFAEKDPSKLPWKKLGVDIVVEATGFFTARDEAAKHLRAGAKKVVITAPAKNPDITILPGVNSKELKKTDKIISVASCTTNALLPVIKVLDDNFGVERGFMNTAHAYTATQGLVDGPNKSLRRGRAAAQNIIPSTSGATEAVGDVLPKMKNKMNGLSLRVPVLDGSIVDFVAILKKSASVEQINYAFKKAAEKELKGIMRFNEDEIVSSDIIGDRHSSIVDGTLTQSMGNFVRVLAWYDNEYGYTNRVIDVLKMLK